MSARNMNPTLHKEEFENEYRPNQIKGDIGWLSLVSDPFLSLIFVFCLEDMVATAPYVVALLRHVQCHLPLAHK